MLRLVVDHSGKERRIGGLYLITDQAERLVHRVREALSSGGVAVLQYRDKVRSYEERLELGQELKHLCTEFQVEFIVNDDVELAFALDADGVHLGQDDGDPAAAREALGPKKMIGISTHSLTEALEAQEAGADYVGFGAIYPTDSKEVEHIQGPEKLVLLKEKLRIPVVAIGGITRDNACAVIDAGADAIAVISAVLSARSPALAATELALLFNRKAMQPRGGVLTVAGSDSGGGAGIQADLKTVTLLGSYGASAVTALTAQNTRGVTAIHPVPAAFLAEQIDAVLTDIPIDVVKVGMLSSAENAATLADRLTDHGVRMVVLDPVMSAKGGVALMEDEALGVLKQRLIPLCYLLTPNIPEAEALTGLTITDTAGMELAARALHLMGAKHVLVKGGHLTEGVVTDILFDGAGFTRFTAPRVLTRNTHGTGCTLASAIASYLAQGEPLPGAVLRAKLFVTRAIKYAQPLGKGHGPVNHFMAARDQAE
ncbi:4-amino-5-hydroxymethyl-2-methylpyrimidine-phosphate kinase and thiamin monophosphate synthase [Citrifermentans bemidjiense Bem]|uniref:Thiamine-phosphate synthase n=1 Tax=Citrifermentans bemidjiense (strain ATCC BAA-1014 / DSM 16622 / JCM 12645 / Bem) TaxID=404380 RepID=B5EBG3_CITBB|nr:bifunctional hydroxymethylpyrimidine kinase/phosphomethylpyrimidine kinase [Citrifermentans bemidjiense]ACH40455.1 4-amino-5-hydroxymethyl-2-methylpyrimidine-phosphate kinase and thiamin monophosphate synthase [Citrifermentans bemidjiense Bem]